MNDGLRFAGMMILGSIAVALILGWFVWLGSQHQSREDFIACQKSNTFEQCIEWREQGRF